MSECVFCKIIAGEIPGHFVLREKHCCAFLDIQPINRGHLLVVPRNHAAALADLTPADGAALFQTAQRLAAALRESGLPCEGVNLWLADGAAAGQEIEHVHLHVVPRHAGDGFGFTFGPDHGGQPDAELLSRTAARIAAKLESAV